MQIGPWPRAAVRRHDDHVTGRARLLGGVGAAIGLLMLVVYLALIINEGDDSFLDVAPWAFAIVTASGAAATGAAAAPGRLGARLMLLAGLMFLVIGIPAIFSVGFPLILAGLLCLLASSAAAA